MLTMTCGSGVGIRAKTKRTFRKFRKIDDTDYTKKDKEDKYDEQRRTKQLLHKYCDYPEEDPKSTNMNSRTLMDFFNNRT